MTAQPIGQCWEWPGYVNDDSGYGRVWDGTETDAAHRWVYSMLRGVIPAARDLDHLCRNRRCVNPWHLEPVTRRENLLRSPITRASINAAKTHCPRGHEYTPENTRVRIARGTRECRTCERERARAKKALVKASAA